MSGFVPAHLEHGEDEWHYLLLVFCFFNRLTKNPNNPRLGKPVNTEQREPKWIVQTKDKSCSRGDEERYFDYVLTPQAVPLQITLSGL